MTTPKERAAALIEAQGDELSRCQRMFLAQDIEREITEAVEERVAAIRDAWQLIEAEFLPALAHHYNAEDEARFLAPMRKAVEHE